ncbi:Uncharacterised protein [Mycobacteroides abscessus]|nr:Uncharacterised protein [Mycobacteroides abscessus]
MFSPNTRYRAWCTAKRRMSSVEKNSRWYRARARWNDEAPRMIVLSTSKNAAVRCGGPGARAGASSGSVGREVGSGPGPGDVAMPPL